MTDELGESTPLAFPIDGLNGSREAAGALEAVLRQLAGVIRAYVSPITALAYIDFQPAQLSEEQLVGAIAGAGYNVDVHHRRFAWRRH
ncbi:MAG: heavy-metal-associated domain-containing protein [Dehalococcoidia bacterium]